MLSIITCYTLTGRCKSETYFPENVYKNMSMRILNHVATHSNTYATGKKEPSVKFDEWRCTIQSMINGIQLLIN